MSGRREIFDAIKAARGGKGWADDEILQTDRFLDGLGVPAAQTPRTRLADPAAFFAAIRRGLFDGRMTPEQVDGINVKLDVMGAASWPVAYAAYGFATSFWETAKAMQPVREGYYLGEPAAERHRKTLRYYPWYGRGDVQTTWEANYRRADKELGLGGSLIANPDRMLEPTISAQTMVRGMQEGWFTGRKLSHYLPATGTASVDAFVKCRPIINGTDKAAEIARIAATFQSALLAGGWG